MVKLQKDFLKRLFAILNLIPVSVYIKDINGKYLGCNKYMLKMAGVSSQQDVIGKSDKEFVWKDIADKLEKIDKSVMEDEIIYEGEETPQVFGKENSTYLTTKTPLYDSQQNVIGLIGISVNVTERKKQKEELKQAKEQAEKANKLKTDFISNMEHDIRTPLVGIYGMMEILANKETDPEKKPLMHAMTLCAKELMDFCNDILDFSKIETESFPVVAKSFALKKVVDSVLSIESMAAKNKKLNLSSEFDKQLPQVVMSDPYRIKRILINLVSNAIKFTKEGKVKISISLDKKDTQNRRAIIKFVVTDTGMGIPDDKKALIYERFTKITQSNRGLYKGLGLGLRIVKQFVDELDGDIHLKSEAGKGSTFTLFLPFKIPLSDEIIDEDCGELATRADKEKSLSAKESMKFLLKD